MKTHWEIRTNSYPLNHVLTINCPISGIKINAYNKCYNNLKMCQNIFLLQLTKERDNSQSLLPNNYNYASPYIIDSIQINIKPRSLSTFLLRCN